MNDDYPSFQLELKLYNVASLATRFNNAQSIEFAYQVTAFVLNKSELVCECGDGYDEDHDYKNRF